MAWSQCLLYYSERSSLYESVLIQMPITVLYICFRDECQGQF